MSEYYSLPDHLSYGRGFFYTGLAQAVNSVCHSLYKPHTTNSAHVSNPWQVVVQGGPQTINFDGHPVTEIVLKAADIRAYQYGFGEDAQWVYTINDCMTRVAGPRYMLRRNGGARPEEPNDCKQFRVGGLSGNATPYTFYFACADDHGGQHAFILTQLDPVEASKRLETQSYVVWDVSHTYPSAGPFRTATDFYRIRFVQPPMDPRFRGHAGQARAGGVPAGPSASHPHQVQPRNPRDPYGGAQVINQDPRHRITVASLLNPPA